jgi:hypothetical protein
MSGTECYYANMVKGKVKDYANAAKRQIKRIIVVIQQQY